MQHQKERMSQKKLRIGDLAKELNIKKYVIRFWEKEFELASDRSEGGQRYYTEDDLKLFVTIKSLLYEKGFTIAGAKKQLKNKKAQVEEKTTEQSEKNIMAATKDTSLDTEQHKEFMTKLAAFKKELKTFKNLLE